MAMPSKQSEAVRRRWEAARVAMVQPDGEGPDDESWGDLTAEPRGVDYLESEAGGRPAMWAVPKNASADRVLLCIHGGGFVSGSVYTHRKMFGHLAKVAGARALLVEYRLLPEGGGYPVPVDEVEAAYRWLLDQGTAAGHVAFAGDSTGGWLAVTVQLRARDHGLPLPAAAMLLSPAVDMEVNGESFQTNRDKDPFFHRELVRGLIGSFLGDADPRDRRGCPGPRERHRAHRSERPGAARPVHRRVPECRHRGPGKGAAHRRRHRTGRHAHLVLRPRDMPALPRTRDRISRGLADDPDPR